MKVGVLTNLNSKNNRSGGFNLPGSVVGDDCLVRRTRDVAEIEAALGEFIDRGCECWVSDGGDGSMHWILNVGRDVLRRKGLWGDGLAPYPMIVPSNGGSIDYVARAAGIRCRPDQVISRLMDDCRANVSFKTVQLDTLEVRGHVPGDAHDVWSFERLGFAIAVGGVGQKFFKKFYERPTKSPFGIIDISAKASVGCFASLLPDNVGSRVPAEMRDLGQYILSGTRAEVVADGRRFEYDVYQGLHAASIEIDFGAMRLFQYAREPGMLHIVVGAMPLLQCALKWPWYVAGKPIPGRQWHEFAGHSLEVRARGDALLDPVIDGELFFGFDAVSVGLGPVVTIPVI